MDCTGSGLPCWASLLKQAKLKEGFVHGFVDELSQVSEVLELHSRACITDYVRR